MFFLSGCLVVTPPSRPHTQDAMGGVLLKSGSAFYHYEGFQVLLALLEVLRPFN